MPAIYKFSDQQQIIDKLLTEPHSPGLLEECLRQEGYKFFFVTISGHQIGWSPKALQADMVRVLGNRGVPSKKTLNSLKQEHPIFLGNVLTLHFSFQRYFANPSATFAAALGDSGFSRGLRDQSVVSSLNMFDARKVSMKGYNILHYCMTAYGVKKRDIAEHLENKCQSVNGYRFIDELLSRSLTAAVKRSPGEARITFAAARCLWDFLKEIDARGYLNGKGMNDVFEFSPSAGSGNGKWTSSLLRGEGNIML